LFSEAVAKDITAISSAVSNAFSSANFIDFGANLQRSLYENVREGIIKAFLWLT
jgi:hypothetical protein